MKRIDKIDNWLSVAMVSVFVTPSLQMLFNFVETYVISKKNHIFLSSIFIDNGGTNEGISFVFVK